jgi:hypothetical protein
MDNLKIAGGVALGTILAYIGYIRLVEKKSEEEIFWNWKEISTDVEKSVSNFPKEFIWGVSTAAHQGISVHN